MFYKIIEKKRDEWLNSDKCVITNLISYIERQHKLRDAQIESIKTYLFLKIECQNKPLWELFASGKFNSINIHELEVNSKTRDVLSSNPAALALWEFASIKDETGNINSPMIIDAIRQYPETIDYERILKDLFFNVSYSDYLFSIPMGAGKTYLMAAFIYLNLYFAFLEPNNPLFAHNFLILVPSSLKSSIIPSLRDIQNFDPLWILPDPVASQLRNIIKYEWLQENSSASKSNIVKNPNARKINMHLSDPYLMGLVAITNAEKVILDRIDKQTIIDTSLLNKLNETDRKEYEATLQANELREQISKIPNLCILIDEVHHASEEQKLRLVVNSWMQQSNFNSVLGFSGTPNMNPPLKVSVYEDLVIKHSQFANVVTYYPLIRAIGNFLKVPTVRYAEMDSSDIISNGLREFFDEYKDKTYSTGTIAKIAIYAPSIAVLEEEVYPEVCAVCSELGIDYSEAILKYHKGNSEYPVDVDAQYEFSILDSPLSKKRIILLVGIGREGWNCKSLTGIILSQRSACPQNMVLQISCRCLREVDSAQHETALIWLNKSNADTLNRQLKEQQYTTLKEFGSQTTSDLITISRYSRMEKLKLPPIEFYQLRIIYENVEYEKNKDIGQILQTYNIPYIDDTIIYTQNFESLMLSESMSNYGNNNYTCFRSWIDLIVKEGIGTITVSDLLGFEKELHDIYSKITHSDDIGDFYDSRVDHAAVRSDIRKLFVPKRYFNTIEDVAFEKVSLLKTDALSSPIEVSANAIYNPSEATVSKIIAADNSPTTPTISEEELKVLKAMKARGIPVEIPDMSEMQIYNRTYHYLPYHLDSKLEEDYMENLISYLRSIPSVEFYFNGDDTLTDFKIRCYQKRGHHWKSLGDYYPDFIMLTRNEDNSINKILIIETKGEGFAGKFEPRKKFVKDIFIKLNNEKYGQEKFAFLYIEDTDKPDERLKKTKNKINSFFSC